MESNKCRSSYKVLRSRRVSTTEQDKRKLIEGVVPGVLGAIWVVACAVSRSPSWFSICDETAEANWMTTYPSNLISAVKKGDVEEVRHLIDLGGDVNKTEDGCSLLMLAIMYGHPSIAKLLVNTGADVSYPVFQICGDGEVRKTALDYAVERNMDSVHELIERRLLATKNIQMAVEDGNSKLTKSLLQQDADINTPTDNGESLLMRAIRTGRRDVVRLLLDEGIDVAYVLLVRKSSSPGKRRILRENAKTYAEKYMPDMHPMIVEALRPYEEEDLVPNAEDEDDEHMNELWKKTDTNIKRKSLSHLCIML